MCEKWKKIRAELTELLPDGWVWAKAPFDNLVCPTSGNHAWQSMHASSKLAEALGFKWKDEDKATDLAILEHKLRPMTKLHPSLKPIRAKK